MEGNLSVSGRIEDYAHLYILLFSGCAAGVDLARARIPNFLTLPSILVGIALALLTEGLPGVGTSLLGVLVGLLAYGWIYALGMLGAGDVKFLMALGALGGWRYGLDVAILSFLLGGFFSAGLLAVRGKLAGFLRRGYRFLLTRLVRGLEPEPFRVDTSEKFPFGVAMAFAAIWSLHGRPLAELGWSLW